MNDLRALALALTDGIGWKLVNRLIDQFGSLEAILAADFDSLQTVRGIGPHIAGRIRAIDLDRITAIVARSQAQGIRYVTWEAPDYPVGLCALEDRPLALFVRGVFDLKEIAGRPSIAIVGTREPSRESERLAVGWANAFARRGWLVISGLARGVDTLAHRGALGAGGATMAILGCGVNRVYPPENHRLAHVIAENGALISETAPDQSPSRDLLVFRNRLIAALSRALIVIEAGPESGALHAARRALALGHPVFALPNSDGNQQLIREAGARQLPADPAQIRDILSEIAIGGS